MLGYDYWTESPYEYIRPFIKLVAQTLNINEKQFTFYNNHEEIDKKHGKDVENILNHVCKSEKDWEDITETALITLDLTRIIHKHNLCFFIFDFTLI